MFISFKYIQQYLVCLQVWNRWNVIHVCTFTTWIVRRAVVIHGLGTGISSTSSLDPQKENVLMLVWYVQSFFISKRHSVIFSMVC